jgi:hypothetical protein
VKFEIKMTEDFQQTFWPNVKLLKWRRYDIEVEKYDYHADWHLSVSCFPWWTDKQVKIFTDRFEILADKKTIWNTGIIEKSMVTIKKADKDLKWMAWYIDSPRNWKGVVSFTNLRWENFYLLEGDEVESNNTDERLVLWERKDNREAINKVISSVKQWQYIKESKYEEIYKIFNKGLFSEISEDEHYKWSGNKLVFDSRTPDWDLDNQVEIITTYKDNEEKYFVDYIY